MRVTTWSLQMLQPAAGAPRPLPEGVRLERADGITPEYARFLYALVGGNWYWLDRLRWSREQWAEELAIPGREFWVLYGDGVPLGYVHLHPVVEPDGTHVEIRYFGLAQPGLGRRLGGLLLEHGIAAAWSIPERSELPAVVRVWVHTCTLDGPAALTNYQARGLEVFATEQTEEELPETAPGPWVASGGPASSEQ
ncbi:GNAT family N-acetyltransferase [Micropruina sp.]|uniref:GNAT family N-acetyltransferase n=1 Tax=Micropruina sp. TaxID=2737536 RepID=UPI00261D582E|nr:GNAT family N-acetyltransferase [Micropruina sp.]